MPLSLLLSNECNPNIVHISRNILLTLWYAYNIIVLENEIFSPYINLWQTGLIGGGEDA